MFHIYQWRCYLYVRLCNFVWTKVHKMLIFICNDFYRLWSVPNFYLCKGISPRSRSFIYWTVFSVSQQDGDFTYLCLRRHQDWIIKTFSVRTLEKNKEKTSKNESIHYLWAVYKHTHSLKMYQVPWLYPPVLWGT